MFARRLLELCWKFAGSCKHPITDTNSSAELLHNIAEFRIDGAHFQMPTNCLSLESLKSINFVTIVVDVSTAVKLLSLM